LRFEKYDDDVGGDLALLDENALEINQNIANHGIWVT